MTACPLHTNLTTDPRAGVRQWRYSFSSSLPAVGVGWEETGDGVCGRGMRFLVGVGAGRGGGGEEGGARTEGGERADGAGETG